MEGASMPRASAFTDIMPPMSSASFSTLIANPSPVPPYLYRSPLRGEGLEQARPGLSTEPDARVAHSELQLLALRCDGQHHFALVGELDRVA